MLYSEPENKGNPMTQDHPDESQQMRDNTDNSLKGERQKTDEFLKTKVKKLPVKRKRLFKPTGSLLIINANCSKPLPIQATRKMKTKPCQKNELTMTKQEI
jgi:hypothetical protein